MGPRCASRILVFGVLVLATTRTSALDLHGYWRTGLGGNGVGGRQTCFGLDQFGFKFRLGNECETYGEIEIRETLYKGRDGLQFDFASMLAVLTTQDRTFDSLKFDGSFNSIALRQIWIGARLPELWGGATIWVGNRYFHRNDVHILDFFYWDPSGPGAGIEDITLGFGKLALSVFTSPFDVFGTGEGVASGPPLNHGSQGRRQIWRPDIRVYGIPSLGGGDLEVGLDLFVDWTNTTVRSPNPSGMTVSPWLTVQHYQPAVLGGFNKLAFQIAWGSAAVMSPFPQEGSSSASRQWRIVEQLVFNPMPELSGMVTLVYQDFEQRLGGCTTRCGDYDSARLYTAGIRPAWHFTDYFKLVVEVGLQAIDPKDDDGSGRGLRTLLKATIAPTLVAGRGFFARPELRLFATYATWSAAAQQRNVAGFDSFGPCLVGATTSPWGCDTHGVTFGAQAEAWW